MRALSDAAPRRRPKARLSLAALAAVVLAGCGSSAQEGSRLTVHVGGTGDPAEARATAEGAELALEQAGGEAAEVPVELQSVPASGAAPAGAGRGEWAQAEIAAGARLAAQDSTAIAYLGEPDSAATAISVPVTNEAGILQIATGPVAEELLREPGGNDVPDDFQTTGERTLIGLVVEGGQEPAPDPGFEADFEDAYGRAPEPAAAYGHAAMSLVLDSIEASDDPLDRFAVIEAALATGERESALGTYSIDPGGAGTLGG
jgi:hypothetical protein